MKKIILLISLSLVFSQELKVEGNLNVTGAVINDSLVQVIDSLKTTNVNQQDLISSLQALIAQLQAQIASLEAQMAFLGQDMGNADCFGVVGGDAVLDGCGVCGGDNSTCTTIIDIDGNVYPTVQIGEQNWMAKNLKVKNYRNGYNINEYNLGDGGWDDNDDGGYIEIDDNLYYQWHSITNTDGNGICPEGWHVPSDEEWKELEMYLGICPGYYGDNETYYEYDTNGGCLDDRGWRGTNEGEILANLDMLDILQIGYIHDETVEHRTDNTYFWTTNEDINYSFAALHRGFSNETSKIYRHDWNKYYGFSIRCIQD